MSISLKPHNIETYEKVNEKLNETNRAAVIHPPGTGKMFIALKLLEDNKRKKAIYVAPYNAILHDVKKNIFANGMTMADFPQLTRITYKKLASLSDEEIEKLEADIIILDEFHHCGGPEYGKGVNRLLQRNKGAKILGLSATPLRYFDGLRDMADELFENSVASEMTLEEAIERGILPEVTYVSSLYGYSNELVKMQEKVNNIKDKDKQQQAQNLMDVLKRRLDADTDNLADLFFTYMKNPNGKYIIFCRNIDDMNEKVKQAQEMFEKVNPNITVRAVSSRIKESDHVLTEFEQDSDEGTLKLLYSVNMINEGYHIRGLDGVIMMRPTYSPTMYTQQVGRAFSIGGDKKSVVLDLVNNFDSCKIIEDFAERMKQYKGREGSGRAKDIKKGKISIFDKTKEFREIVEIITELSSKKSVSLEEKIQMFERFVQTGEDLVGNTIFEGYPIGQWAIQIRNGVNRINNGKKGRGTINPTEEQIERLKKLGILERQIESTIDEKIDSLVEWRRKYPKATITPVVSIKILRQYATTEEELKQLLEEYEKMQNYYIYVRTRKSRGKLSEEQIKKCIEGNIGRAFGKKAIESEKNELIAKYGLDEEIIDFIRKQYGSIDEFRNVYIEAVINQNIDEVIPKKILENVNLIRSFDLGSPDWALRNNGLADFLIDLDDEHRAFMNYEGLEEKIIEISNFGGFTEQEKQVMYMLYGLNGEKKVNQTQAAQKIGKSNSRVAQVIAKALRIMGYPSRSKYLETQNRAFDIDYDIQKEIIEEYFKYFDIFIAKEPIDMDKDVKAKLETMLSDGIEKTKKRNAQVKIIERMSEEQRLDILKARFGESINKSDIGVVPHWHHVYKRFESTNDIVINEEIFRNFGWYNLSDISYKECLSSEYCQSKIAEFMVNSLSNSELVEVGKREEIEKLIASNEIFSKKKKYELKELLSERLHAAVKEKILEEIGVLTPTITSEKISGMVIEELDLSIRSFNCLKRAGINTVEDFMGKSVEEFMKTKNLGKKGYDEVIEKMQSLGIEIVDGYFEAVGTEACEYSKEQIENLDESTIINIENEINDSDVLEDDEKETLRNTLHEKYQDMRKKRISMEEEKLHSEIMDSIKTISGERLKEMPIEALDLSVRSFNCLYRAGIRTIEDILEKSREDLEHTRNLGKRSYDEVVEKMQLLGIEIYNRSFCLW